MKFLAPKISVFILFAIFISCNTAKNLDINLPKDIAEKPLDEDSQKYIQIQLDRLKNEIETEISNEKCTETTINKWKSTALGIKSYIAYPKNRENLILPKIENYNNKEKEFNQKYNIPSDHSFSGDSLEIRCINGKAEAINFVE